jgi:hypothetical protein
MTPVVAGAFASALLASLFTAVGWAVLAQSLARRLGRHNIIDTLWRLGFV